MNNIFIINVSLLIFYKKKFLCIKRSMTESVFPGYWGIPGGKVENIDDSLEAAIKRECMEEIGIVINTPLCLISNNIVYKNNKNILYMVFVTECMIIPISYKIGSEVEEIGWKTYEEIRVLEKVTPKTVDIIKNFIDRLSSNKKKNLRI